MLKEEIQKAFTEHIGDRPNDEWNVEGLISALNIIFPVPKDLTAAKLASLSAEEIKNQILEAAQTAYEEKEKATGPQRRSKK